MNEKFLKEGPLTKVTPLIKDLASQVDGDSLDLLFNISKYINSTLLKDFRYITSESELIEKEH